MKLENITATMVTSNYLHYAFVDSIDMQTYETEVCRMQPANSKILPRICKKNSAKNCYIFENSELQ